jgi:hypothetical protein
VGAGDGWRWAERWASELNYEVVVRKWVDFLGWLVPREHGYELLPRVVSVPAQARDKETQRDGSGITRNHNSTACVTEWRYLRMK